VQVSSQGTPKKTLGPSHDSGGEAAGKNLACLVRGPRTGNAGPRKKNILPSGYGEGEYKKRWKVLDVSITETSVLCFFGKGRANEKQRSPRRENPEAVGRRTLG